MVKLLSLVVSAALALAGCAPSEPVVTPQPTPSPTPQPTPSPTPKPEPTPAADYATPSRVYLLLTLPDGTTGLVPAQRWMFMSADPPVMETVQALLDGPTKVENASDPAPFTRIPAGTRLLSIDAAGPVARISLSREFLDGSSEAVLQRLAQVVYTLTQFPAVTSVSILVGGTAVTAPFASGALRRPLKRTDFTAQLPAIFVDTPAWGDDATNPLTIQGYANVPEAQFTAQLRDAAGTVLAAQVVTASCGTGCWGTFLTTLPYTVTTVGWGTLRVFDASAKDGAPENERIYPIMLRPKAP